MVSLDDVPNVSTEVASVSVVDLSAQAMLDQDDVSASS